MKMNLITDFLHDQMRNEKCFIVVCNLLGCDVPVGLKQLLQYITYIGLAVWAMLSPKQMCVDFIDGLDKLFSYSSMHMRAFHPKA